MSDTTTTPAKKTAAKKTAATDPKKAAHNRARNEAYSAATGRLRDEYRDRFEDLLADECAKRGVEYKRRLTDEEKAQKQLDELYEKFPHLRPAAVPANDGADPAGVLPQPVPDAPQG